MKKHISVEIEFFDFKKSKIKHLKEDMSGMYYSFEEKMSNFFIAKIRIDTSQNLIMQFASLIHEFVHCAFDYFLEFRSKKWNTNKFYNFKNISNKHNFIYKIGGFAGYSLEEEIKKGESK